MESILNALKDAGIKTDPGKNHDISAESSYRGNFGFFRITGRDWELLFLKGVYKGHIRRIKGECPIEEKQLNTLAQILADAERCLRHPADLGISFDGEHFFICRADRCIQPFISPDKRDRFIPYPLTPVEASLGRHSGINDKYLFAKSPFASVFGDTLSPFAFSLAEMLPDIMNPLFIGSAVKTLSPSVKPFFGRIYLNISNADVITSAFKTTPDLFYMSFLPSVYKTLKKTSFDVPDLSVLNLKDGEITASIEDIVQSAESLTIEEMLSDSFFELLALCVMTWEMSYLSLWQSFADILKLTKDTETAMQHIYKSRKGGLITTDVPVMPFFDPAYEPAGRTPVVFTPLTPDELYKSLPQTKRLLTSKSRYEDRLSKAHSCLDRLDRTYLAVSSLVHKVRNLLLETADDLINKNIIKDRSDIFYLEYKEIKNIVNDEFYGNIPFTLNFRKWQNHRHSSLCMPPYVYEKDVENIFEITEKQMDRSEKERSIPCISFFHREITTDNYICRSSFGIGDIGTLDKYDAVVAESASIFSYAAQYCAVKDKPLYTGARFAALLTKGRAIKTGKESISL